MVSINIGAGQGVTQAIASKLGLSKDDLKRSIFQHGRML